MEAFIYKEVEGVFVVGERGQTEYRRSRRGVYCRRSRLFGPTGLLQVC